MAIHVVERPADIDLALVAVRYRDRPHYSQGVRTS